MKKSNFKGTGFKKAVKAGVNQIGDAFSSLFDKKIIIKKVSTSI